MGVDFDALLFYGMPVSGDSDLIWDLVETFQELNGPLDITNLDSYRADGTHMLFVRESYKAGDETSEPIMVRMSEVTGKETEWRQLIVDACAANGITFTEPDWYFATAFS